MTISIFKGASIHEMTQSQSQSHKKTMMSHGFKFPSTTTIAAVRF